MITDNVSTILATAREARRRDQAAPKAAKPAARKAAAKSKAARPSAVASMMDKFLAAVADQVFEVEATAKKLGVAPKMVRNCIDQLRRKGGKAACQCWQGHLPARRQVIRAAGAALLPS